MIQIKVRAYSQASAKHLSAETVANSQRVDQEITDPRMRHLQRPFVQAERKISGVHKEREHALKSEKVSVSRSSDAGHIANGGVAGRRVPKDELPELVTTKQKRGHRLYFLNACPTSHVRAISTIEGSPKKALVVLLAGPPSIFLDVMSAFLADGGGENRNRMQDFVTAALVSEGNRLNPLSAHFLKRPSQRAEPS